MNTIVNPLGCHSAQIESEYLERLVKVRFGLDRGWRPPGLLLKGGTAVQRRHALERLRELALLDGFFCSYFTLRSDLTLRDTRGICLAAIKEAGLAQSLEPGSDPHLELKRLAASARQFGRNGWVLLIDNVDRFEGTTVARAESYRELVRWMGTLPEETDYIGLFCVLAVTSEFERAVADHEGDLASIRADLRSASTPENSRLLHAAEAGIGALDHEAIVRELLVLE